MSTTTVTPVHTGANGTQTDEFDATDDEIAFLKAMATYPRTRERPLPTWSEVLEVLRSLGYRRANCPPEPELKWREVCLDLRRERDQLQQEVLELRRERDQYRSAALLLTAEEIEFDERAFAERIANGPNFETLIDESEAAGGAP